jgi:hypothetical protein
MQWQSQIEEGKSVSSENLEEVEPPQEFEKLGLPKPNIPPAADITANVARKIMQNRLNLTKD